MGAGVTALRVVEDRVDIRQLIGHTEDDTASAIQMLSLAELRQHAASIKWLVKYVIPDDSLGVFFGGSGCFKTFIAVDMAMHIAHGMPWLGRKTKKGPVIIICGEGGGGLWKRIEAWHRVNHRKWEDASVYVVPVPVDLLTEADRVVAAAKALGIIPALVVVDTLAQTFSGDENSATDIGAYLRTLGMYFRAGWQCAVTVIHHTGHANTERPRGSSSIRNNVDFLFGVFRDEKEMLATVECIKQKDGSETPAQAFQARVETLGQDDDGDDITSLVTSALGGSTAVLDAMEHEATRGRGGKNQMFLSLAQNGALESEVRKAFYTEVDGDADTKRQAYFRAKKWALSAQILEVVDGRIIRSSGA